MRVWCTIAIHAVLTVMAYTSWLWLDWRAIATIAALHIAMLKLFKGCPLSHAQFPDDKSKTFYEWWMPKVGIEIPEHRRPMVRIFMTYISPFIIVLLAILDQYSGLNFLGG